MPGKDQLQYTVGDETRAIPTTRAVKLKEIKI